eukprot:365808-Chlamydomonas_euryale.AAC.20
MADHAAAQLLSIPCRLQRRPKIGRAGPETCLIKGGLATDGMSRPRVAEDALTVQRGSRCESSHPCAFATYSRK